MTLTNKLTNKKGFSAMDYVVAALIFSGIIALLVVAVGSMASEYENTNVVNEKFAERFDKFENDTFRSEQMWNATTGEGGLSLVGSVEILFFSTFRVIALVFSSVVEAGSQLFGMGEFFGIPTAVSAIFFTLIFAILTTIIIFKILNSVKGTNPL